jgi:hypothetical protein
MITRRRSGEGQGCLKGQWGPMKGGKRRFGVCDKEPVDIQERG